MSLLHRARSTALMAALVGGLTISHCLRAADQVLISEFLADNQLGLLDRDGHPVDWIELHNAGTDPVNLEGWGLTDERRNLWKWRLPAVVLAPGEYRLVFASGKDRTNATGELHTNFKLSASGENLALVRPDGTSVVAGWSGRYPAQFPDVSYGVERVNNEWQARYFGTPTPRAANGAGGTAVAERPALVPATSTFTNLLEVTLVADAPDAVIRYTLDGSLPGTNSTAYAGPLVVSNTVWIKARTFIPGQVPSEVNSATYLKLASNVVAFSSTLPLVVVNAFDRTISESARVPVHVSVFERGAPDQRARVQGIAPFGGRAGMEIRGSSSAGFPKVGYRVELQDDAGRDRGASLLGLPSDSDWVFYASYNDKSLMRDPLAYELSRRIGRYAPRTRYFEMFLNRGNSTVEMADYLGVYVLVEKLKIDGDRLDLQEIEPDHLREPEMTGGYLIKRDRYEATDQRFTSARGLELAIEEPKPTDAGPQQRAWIKAWVDEMETALFSPGWTNVVDGYERYLDRGSFVDYHLLVEASKNIDAWAYSTFYHKEREGRLVAGPLWDYNLSFGNADYLDGWKTNGWYYPMRTDAGLNWIARLLEDPEFLQQRTDRWHQLRSGPFRDTEVLGLVDTFAAELRAPQFRNFDRWRVLGRYVWPNWFIAKTWQEEVDWMKGWITNRFAWIDGQLPAPPRALPAGGLVSEGATVQLVGKVDGPVFYTTNGTDPRGTGGGVAAAAQEYRAPFSLTTDAVVVARTRLDGQWSAPSTNVFVTRLLPLAITEVMFAPAAASPGEFIELRNLGAEAVALPGVGLRGAVTWQFPEGSGSLMPGECLIVTGTLSAWAGAGGALPQFRIAGNWAGELPEAGGTVELVGPLGELIQTVRYDPAWHPKTAGSGFSLETVVESPVGPRVAAADWRSSAEVGGTPGRPNRAAVSAPRLAASLVEGRLRITAEASAGAMLVLEGRGNLDSGDWKALREVVAEGPTTDLGTWDPADGAQFYRVTAR